MSDTVVMDDLVKAAQAAQDRLGWAEPTDYNEVTYAAVDLARVVVKLAQEVRRVMREKDAEIDRLRGDLDERSAQLEDAIAERDDAEQRAG